MGRSPGARAPVGSSSVLRPTSRGWPEPLMTAGARTRSMRLTGAVKELAALRSFVRDAAAEFGAGPLATDDLVQAVDEAACNIVIHGYGNAPGEIEAEAALRGDRIEITLLDRGRAFDPTAVPAPDLSVPPMARTPG